MRIIGVTGGVGAGKSTVLKMLEELTKCIVIRTDEVAKETTLPGGAAYSQIVKLLGDDILQSDGCIDRKKMASIIFSDEKLCEKVDAIIHPLTRSEVVRRLKAANDAGVYEYAFIEAALLIEAGYDSICEEFWYIYVPDEERIKRLMADRGYSREKCISIMNNQLPGEEFRKHCRYVIDNSKDSNNTKKQLERILLLVENRTGGEDNE